MQNILKGLEPEAVFQHFEAISQIPRESGNEKQISDFLVDWSRQQGLEVIQEDSLNVIIKKQATNGYDQAPTVILQGHMDMVCVKKEDFEFDFAKDPIPLVVDGDFVKTKGTTLGADNGIAVAMILAILEADNIEHPALTALITVAEETGMDGVLSLNPEHVKGNILINIDSEEEGIMLASCAGGVNNIVRIPVDWKESDSKKLTYQLSVKGLRGGHSGIEIDKNRASAIKLLGRLLKLINENMDIDIANVSGGEKMNAIPKLAQATILVAENQIPTLQTLAQTYQEMFKKEFEASDPNIEVKITEVDQVKQIFDVTTKKNLIHSLRLMPFGVQTMSSNIKGLVESSNNIGTLETKANEIVLSSAVRSSVKSLKEEINDRIASICDLIDSKMELVSDYPAWEFAPQSTIRNLMNDVYQDLHHTEMKVDAIHAGLECGFLQEKLGNIDMVSIGPNIYNAHTPEESLSISSTKKVYEFLVEVLKMIK